MSPTSTTLYDRIKYNDPLTDGEMESLVAMIGKGCRQKTKDRLLSRVNLPLSLWPLWGIYSRVSFGEYKDGEATYCCGQSWSDEMRTLRECILGI